MIDYDVATRRHMNLDASLSDLITGVRLACKLWKSIYKRRFLKELLEDPRSESSSLERYKAALKENEEEARRFYGDEIRLSEGDFVDMMLLDGCFIIEFLRRYHNSRRVPEDDNIFKVPWLFNAIKMDLILFENQVPFFILEKLLDMTKFRDQQPQNLIQMAMILPQLLTGHVASGYQSASLDGCREVIHLLDLVHKSCSSSFAAKFTGTSHDGDGDAGSLLDYVKSTSELAESGVKFEKATQNAAWLDITWENGVMKIPQLIVSDYTESLLRNLIAYEQHYHISHERRYIITDYATVMDLLINFPGDVEKLRRSQIIKNYLGDDEAVSTMFNKLTEEVCFNHALFCYKDVLEEVHKFSSKRMNIWRANLMRNYFRTPWSIISFLAAVALLNLTFLQTVFTILSSNKN